ncbi:hypothetical protein HDU67_001761, partial [Dinochytrium kinnereticum]
MPPSLTSSFVPSSSSSSSSSATSRARQPLPATSSQWRGSDTLPRQKQSSVLPSPPTPPKQRNPSQQQQQQQNALRPSVSMEFGRLRGLWKMRELLQRDGIVGDVSQPQPPATGKEVASSGRRRVSQGDSQRIGSFRASESVADDERRFDDEDDAILGAAAFLKARNRKHQLHGRQQMHQQALGSVTSSRRQPTSLPAAKPPHILPPMPSSSSAFRSVSSAATTSTPPAHISQLHVNASQTSSSSSFSTPCRISGSASDLARPASRSSMGSSGTRREGGRRVSGTGARTDSGFYSVGEGFGDAGYGEAGAFECVEEEVVEVVEVARRHTTPAETRQVDGKGSGRGYQQQEQMGNGSRTGHADRQLKKLLAENRVHLTPQQQLQPLHPLQTRPLSSASTLSFGSTGSVASGPRNSAMPNAQASDSGLRPSTQKQQLKQNRISRHQYYLAPTVSVAPLPMPLHVVPPPRPLPTLAALDLPDIVSLYMATAWGCTYLDPTLTRIQEARRGGRQRSRTRGSERFDFGAGDGVSSGSDDDDDEEDDALPLHYRRHGGFEKAKRRGGAGDAAKAFRSFVGHLVGVTVTPSPLVAVSLMYLDRLRRRRPDARLGRGAEGRLFLAGMVVANKMFDDARYTSRVWADVAG